MIGVRLLKKLVRAEEVAAQREAPPLPPVGLCWSNGSARVPARQLEPGEYIACDVHLLGRVAEGVEGVRCVERITSADWDLGIVSDAGGPCGRVVAIDGSLITWRPFDAPEASPVAREIAAEVERLEDLRRVQ